MTEAAGNTPVRSGKNRKVGLVFLLIAVVVFAVVFYSQRELPLPGGGFKWIDDDLPRAMRLAKERNSNVVALFVGKPPSQADRWLRDNTLSEEGNGKALADGNFIAVMVRVPAGRREQVAEQYDVTKFPTTLILSPDGDELKRMVGKIGETDFRYEFLGKVASP